MALIQDPWFTVRGRESINGTRSPSIPSGSVSLLPMTEEEMQAVVPKKIGFTAPEPEVEIEGLA